MNRKEGEAKQWIGKKVKHYNESKRKNKQWKDRSNTMNRKEGEALQWIETKKMNKGKLNFYGRTAFTEVEVKILSYSGNIVKKKEKEKETRKREAIEKKNKKQEKNKVKVIQEILWRKRKKDTRKKDAIEKKNKSKRRNVKAERKKKTQCNK